MFRSALALLLVAVGCAPLFADDNPEFNGKKLSEWTAMLRENESPRLRKVAVTALTQIASDQVNQTRMVKDIVTALGKSMRGDSAPGVRAEAARSLSKLATDLLANRDADVGSVVVDLSEGIRVEKETEVRLEQALALQRYGNRAKSASSSLELVLADKDAKVKEAAAVALGRIGKDAKGASDYLLPLLKDAELAVRKAAVFALGRIEPENVEKPSAELVPLLQSEKDAEMRKEVITSLGLLSDKKTETVKAMAAMLADPNVELRRQTAQSLAKFFVVAKDAEEQLLVAFKTDTDKLVRSYALRTLCIAINDDPSKSLPELIARLDPKVEKEADVRIALCDELGGLGPDAQSAIPQLRLAQKDPELRVRDAATLAIKKIIAKPMPKPDK